MSAPVEWLAQLGAHETLWWWLGSLSLLTFVGSLAALPVLVALLPADYFRRARRHVGTARNRHPALRIIVIAVKNTLGLVLLIAGIAMLVLPGQGLLTILVGLVLLDFPGKFALERRIVRRPRVLRALNWLRAKARKPPLQPPAEG